VSPAQELNSLAKLLTKFVNSVNKRKPQPMADLREPAQVEDPEPMDIEKNQPKKEEKKTEEAEHGAKRKAGANLEVKEEEQNKTR
jgi:hypothetical protein